MRALSGPFPEVTFLPRGGISANAAAAYLEHPAVVAACGSWMVSRDAIADRKFCTVRRLSAEAALLGLVPSESSSSQSRRIGGITKTGNSHARRLLVEAAWQHRRDYRPSAQSVLQGRWAKAPVEAKLLGQACNEWLHQQWVQFDRRMKRPGIANVLPSPASWPAGAGRWPSWTGNLKTAVRPDRSDDEHVE